MHGYTFADSVSACRPADRLILLDLERDRYFGLAEASDRALSRLMAGAADAEDQSAIDAMAAHGLLVPAAEGQLPQLCPAVPIAACGPMPSSGTTSRRRTAMATVAIVRARRGLKRHGLAAMIAELRGRRQFTLNGSAKRRDALAMAFSGASGLVSALDQCLPRSIALTRQLFGSGIDADLVIGVAVQPFRAHCWVQHEGRLLVDDIDTVRQFTPILLL